MAYSHGSLSKVTSSADSGAVTLAIKKFDWEHKKDKHDVSATSTNAGKKSYQLGLEEITFSIEADLDLEATPWTTLQTGDPVEIIWYANGVTANVTIPTAVIESAKVTGAVNDIITWTVTGSSSGAFTIAD